MSSALTVGSFAISAFKASLFVAWPSKAAAAFAKSCFALFTSACVASVLASILFASANASSYACFFSSVAFLYLSSALTVGSLAISAFRASLFVAWPSKAAAAFAKSCFALFTSACVASSFASILFASANASSYACFFASVAFLYLSVPLTVGSFAISAFKASLLTSIPSRAAAASAKSFFALFTSACVASVLPSILFASANASSYACFLSALPFLYLALAFTSFSFAISALRASLFVAWPSKAAAAFAKSSFAFFTSSTVAFDFASILFAAANASS